MRFDVIATRNTRGHVFPYTQAGTLPEETTVGGLGESRITAAPVAEGYVYPYPATSEDAQAGTRPENNIIGVIADGEAQTETARQGYGLFVFAMHGREPVRKR